MLDVQFGGLGGVVVRVFIMPVGTMGMMCGLLMIAAFMLFGGTPMVLGRFFVVFRCFHVMFRCLL